MLQKLDAINPVAKTTTANQTTHQSKVVLAEDAQMRVLAGVSSILEEGRKAKDSKVKEATTKTDKPYTDSSGKIRPGTAVKGTYGDGTDKDKPLDDEEDDDVKPKKKVKESTAAQKAARAKFANMIEAKKVEVEADEKKKDAKKKKMAEGGLPMVKKNGKMVPAFAADGKGKNDLGKEADNDETDDQDDDKDTDSKGLSAKQRKLPPGLQKAIAAKTESKMMPKGKKRAVKESIQQRYSFKECLQLVRESGGQQQIDPIDSVLWKWAQRVAVSKVQEGVSADAMAAFVYERMGGEFALFDVLSEAQ